MTHNIFVKDLLRLEKMGRGQVPNQDTLWDKACSDFCPRPLPSFDDKAYFDFLHTVISFEEPFPNKYLAHQDNMVGASRALSKKGENNEKIIFKTDAIDFKIEGITGISSGQGLTQEKYWD